MSLRHIVDSVHFQKWQTNASQTTNLPDILYYSLPLTESIWNVWPWICPAKSGLRPYAVVSARLVVSRRAHFCVGSTLPSLLLTRTMDVQIFPYLMTLDKKNINTNSKPIKQTHQYKETNKHNHQIFFKTYDDSRSV